MSFLCKLSFLVATAAVASAMVVIEPRTTTMTNSVVGRHDFYRSRKRTIFQLHQQRCNNDYDNDIDNDNENNHDSSRERTKQTRLQSSSSHTKTTNTNNRVAMNLLVATAFATASLLDPMAASSAATDTTPAAAAAAKNNNLDLVSMGTTTIETKGGDVSRQQLVKSTETTLKNLVRTTIFDRKNRAALSESVGRIQSSVKTELNSVDAWKDVIKILKDYGIDLKQDTEFVVRPPADWKKTYNDFLTNHKINLLVNGEILQITIDYKQATNDAMTTEGTSVVQPDDEWVLSVKGYKGVDLTKLNLALDKQQQSRAVVQTDRTPEWYKQWDGYWNEPLGDKNIFSKVVSTNGDVIVIEGVTAIALSYALSYAYYVNELEQGDRKKKEAAKAKKDAAAAAKAKKEAAADASEKEDPPKGRRWGLGKKKPSDQAQKETATKKDAPAKAVAEAKAKKDAPAKPSTKAKKEAATKKDAPAKPSTKAKKEAATKKDAPANAKPRPWNAPEKTPDQATKEVASKKDPFAPNDSPAKPPTEATNEDVAAAAASARTTTSTVKKETKEAPKKPETNEDDASEPKTAATATKQEVPKESTPATDAAAPKESTTVTNPPEATTEIGQDDDDDEVKVDSMSRKEGVVAFAQALYLPWLGFLVSSSSTVDDRSRIVKLVQALFFPWAGVFFPKESTTTTIPPPQGEDDKGDSDSSDNTGVFPVVRALLFPWVGIFRGK